jgi:hypothetical protein
MPCEVAGKVVQLIVLSVKPMSRLEGSVIFGVSGAMVE